MHDVAGADGVAVASYCLMVVVMLELNGAAEQRLKAIERRTIEVYMLKFEMMRTNGKMLEIVKNIA